MYNNIREKFYELAKKRRKNQETKNWAQGDIRRLIKARQIFTAPHKSNRQKRKKRDQKTREYDVELYK